jgi:hypothetical protein
MGQFWWLVLKLGDERNGDEEDRCGYRRSRRIEYFAYHFEEQVQSSVVNRFEYDFPSRLTARLR